MPRNRHPLLGAGFVLATLVAALPGPALAHGGKAETFTATFKDLTETFPDVNPCSGAPATLTVTENGVFHVTMHPDGHFHLTGTFTGDFSLVPDDPAEPSYVGKFTIWFGENHNTNSANGTFTFRITGTGSDGSSLKLNAVSHLTAAEFDFSTDPPTIVDPVVTFDRFNCR